MPHATPADILREREDNAAILNAARDGLVYLPLGGAGEIGMNLNLYGHAGKWLMLDLGIAFGDDSMPGVEVIMPDPAFIEERAKDLVGIVLTHAHEDHLGAVADLWPRLKAPVYATPFAASIPVSPSPTSGCSIRSPPNRSPRLASPCFWWGCSHCSPCRSPPSESTA